MAKKLIDLVKKQLPDVVVDSHSRLGDDTIITRPEQLAQLMAFLRHDERAQMNLLRDITAVDYMHRVPRFEVVYVLYSMKLKHQLIVRVIVEEAKPQVPTVAALWLIAGWLEREVWDMYGITFTGHPDLRRVLLYEEFEGHPLRKDYAIQASQPRTELIARERDAVEEFRELHKKEESAGSRDQL